MTIDALPAPVPQKRNTSLIDRARAMGAMGRAETILGQQGLADALGVTKRSVRYYLSAERGISREAMVLTAAALDAKCSAMAEQAAQLRELAGSSS